jgi:hypothetical protein
MTTTARPGLDARDSHGGRLALGLAGSVGPAMRRALHGESRRTT